MAFPQRRRTPSFSSSLLDAIYRSIDESDGLETATKPTFYRPDSNSNSKTVPSSNKRNILCDSNKLKSLQRAIAMDDENWVYARSSSYGGTTVHHSSSNSSDSSSSAATFSSSETESWGGERRSRRPEKLAAQGKRSESEKKKKTEQTLDERFSKNGDGKLKAVRIFEELKRSKQPISPGARLSSFLNSVFQSNARKVKLCSVGATRDVRSSSSRSCFSRTRHNTAEDKTKNENSGMKRSVRFYPVSVIVDGDCRNKNIHEKNPSSKREFPQNNKGAGKRSSLGDELKISHHSEVTCIASKAGLKHFSGKYEEDEDGGTEENDDVWSYSSSDLFELDHHRARYREELPVYETTDFSTNQAIARGLIL
ncbi:PREDICTED: protein BIG GRAIN 1-like C [Tarenaya hassleriana]|uniref:protein BIG GRAIN 1-like C n=1 Tax=Tarenaya hassleriana TaxID=28532 RepID=UPI00053C4182|nr:PREDICTED: protein BIG GRAIN 1-like C [Tarenaya hassleriana]